MSTDGNRPAEGPEDSAQFAHLFGEGGAYSEPEGGGGEQGQGEGRAEPEGEAQPERQDRERDEAGRYAPRAEPQGEDRAQKGLRKEVTAERGKRQQTQAELDVERREREADRREMAEMRRRLEAYEARQQQPQVQQPQQAETPPKPDRWTDPEAYDKWIEDRAFERSQAFYQQQAVQRTEFSLQDAQRRDPQAYEAAVATLRSLDPQANARVRQQMLLVPDAGAFLLDFHRQEQARREIGADPNAYRERVRSEFASDPATLLKDPATRQAILDHLRAEAAQGGANGGPRTTFTPMPSLNGARGSGQGRGSNPNDGSDAGIWDYASGR